MKGLIVSNIYQKRVVILRKLEARVHQFPKDSPMYVAALCITLPELLDHPKRIAILRKLAATINQDPKNENKKKIKKI